MKIVRGRLFAGDVSPTNLRYDSTCDCVQFSPDDGATWFDTPEADPRHSNAYRYPVLTTSDPQCDAAANMVKWIKDFLDEVTLALGEAASAFTLATIASRFFLLITGGSSVLLDLIFEIGGALSDLGYTALTAAFTPTEYDLLLCAFYCNISSDGSMSAAQLTDVETQVSATLNTTAALVVNLILSTQGEVGASNAGTIGGETGDCSGCACAWCYTFDATASDGGWTPVVISALNFAVYSAGNGWGARIQSDGCANHAYWYIEKALGTAVVNLTSIEVTYASAIGSFDSRPMYQFLSGTQVAASSFDNGSATLHTAPLSATSTDKLRIGLSKCSMTQLYITRITVRGFGTNPFGVDNC